MMQEFDAPFWSWYIIILTVVSIAGTALFLMSQRTRRLAPGEKAQEMEHKWDGDLVELNNPLPSWWVNLFWITMIFSVVYLVLYPGLGSFKGVLGWTSFGEYDAEVQEAKAKYDPVFNQFMGQPIEQVAASGEAREMGQRLYYTYCAQCHGTDAAGAAGFPNLVDKDWLYGGDAESIKASIANGRMGVMPALGAALGEEGTRQVANYVLSLSGANHDAGMAAAGKTHFDTNCAACHGADAKGIAAMGAPNLTDKTWLYGGSEKAIVESITKGRNGVMPAQLQALGEAKVHLLTAYVYGLGGGMAKATGPAPAAAPEAAAPASAPDVAKLYFDSGKADLSADASSALQGIIDFATANADSRIAISGFHDATGSAAANAELAKNRAKAVREALKAAGISEDRIEMRKPEMTEGGGDPAEARRVEVSLL
jgi:cytochrome c oxidase cbb3-type subunit 3